MSGSADVSFSACEEVINLVFYILGIFYCFYSVHDYTDLPWYFLLILNFSPHNFPTSSPVGHVIYNMALDLSRIYLLYGPHQQGRFNRTNAEGFFV